MRLGATRAWRRGCSQCRGALSSASSRSTGSSETRAGAPSKASRRTWQAPPADDAFEPRQKPWCRGNRWSIRGTGTLAGGVIDYRLEAHATSRSKIAQHIRWQCLTSTTHPWPGSCSSPCRSIARAPAPSPRSTSVASPSPGRKRPDRPGDRTRTHPWLSEK